MLVLDAVVGVTVGMSRMRRSQPSGALRRTAQTSATPPIIMRGCKSKECTTLLVPEALRSEAWWTLRPLGGGPEGPKGGRIVVVVD